MVDVTKGVGLVHVRYVPKFNETPNGTFSGYFILISMGPFPISHLAPEIHQGGKGGREKGGRCFIGLTTPVYIANQNVIARPRFRYVFN